MVPNLHFLQTPFTFCQQLRIILKKPNLHEITDRKGFRMTNRFEIPSLLDVNKTIAAALFSSVYQPWEAIPAIREFILTLGETLSDEFFLHPEKDVWIAKTAQVFPSAYIKGPCIIDEEAEIRHCAFIRGSVIVGKHAVVGNSTELKNAVLFDRVQVPHFNYIGDSVLGYRSHIGAGGVTSNVKLDKTPVSVSCPDGRMDTGLMKFGAVLGDFVEVGCNSVLNPGTVIGRGTTVYPGSSVRGYVPENSIYKSDGDIVIKKHGE